MLKVLTFFLLAVIVVCSGFNVDQGDNDTLQSIDYGDTLYLEHESAKCGEWGGDREVIKIYRISKFDNNLLASYTIITMDCADLTRRAKLQVQKVKLTIEDKRLAEDCILELIKNKLRRQSFLAHSGIHNTIRLSDSSLIVNDYPSNKWEQFHLLTSSLLKK